MPLLLSGVLMLISGLGHLAVYFNYENSGLIPLVFGCIYIACSILLLKKLSLGAILTILFVCIGISLGVYGKLVSGSEPAPFSMLFLAIEAVAICLCAVYLVKFRQKT